MTNITHEYYFTLRHSSGGVLYKLKLYERRPFKWYRWKRYRLIDQDFYLPEDFQGIDMATFATFKLNKYLEYGNAEAWAETQLGRYSRKTPVPLTTTV